MKLKLIQGSKTKSQQGFSLLETMIASMVSLIFMSLGANLVLAANIQKIIAKRNITMNNFIQSDLEAIKYQANLIAKDTNVINGKCNAGEDKNGDGSIVEPDEVPMDKGYAGALKTKVGINPPVDVKILNHEYTMTRTIESITDANILPVSYIFTRKNSTNIEHQIYIEILPNAALSCRPAPPT